MSLVDTRQKQNALKWYICVFNLYLQHCKKLYYYKYSIIIYINMKRWEKTTNFTFTKICTLYFYENITNLKFDVRK